MTITLAKVVQTCSSCPSQWDAWTTDGQYLYLRYRFSRGTVEQHPSPDSDTWDYGRDSVVVEFGESGWDGSIELAEFCERAGLQLADGAQVITYEEYWSGGDASAS